jgi:nucleoside-diphosphate-sugar epimerase
MTHIRQRIVVVGHGMVGHRFVQAAIERGLTETHDIVVLGEEPRPAYDRVALTSYFAAGSADELSLLPEGRYDDPRVELRVGARVDRLDVAARTVTLDDDESVAYDQLVLATSTGASSTARSRTWMRSARRRPAEPGASSSGVACWGSRPPTPWYSSGWRRTSSRWHRG